MDGTFSKTTVDGSWAATPTSPAANQLLERSLVGGAQAGSEHLDDMHR